MSTTDRIKEMWFAIWENGQLKKLKGKNIYKDMPMDAEFFVERYDNRETYRLSLEDALKLDYIDQSAPNSGVYMLWAATEGSGSSSETYAIWGHQMRYLWPADMGTLTITPNPTTVEPGETFTLTAEVSGAPAERWWWQTENTAFFTIHGVDNQQSCTFQAKKKGIDLKLISCTAYNYNDPQEELTEFATVTVAEDVLYPGSGGKPDSPKSTVNFSFVNSHAYPPDYKYVIAAGGQGRGNEICVLDNKPGKLTRYVPSGVPGYQLGGCWYSEPYFYIIQSKGTSSPKYYQHHEADTDWTNWTYKSTLSTGTGLAGVVQYSPFGASVGVYGVYGRYMVWGPGKTSWSLHSFNYSGNDEAINTKVTVIGSSTDGTTFMGDAVGKVWQLDSLEEGSSVRKVYTNTFGTNDDQASFVDMATNNKGVWMFAKRKSWNGGSNKGGLVISRDNGKTWETQPAPATRNNCHVYGISYGDGVWLACMTEMEWYSASNLAKSTDDGRTWTSVSESGGSSGQPQTGILGVQYAGNGHWVSQVHSRSFAMFHGL